MVSIKISVLTSLFLSENSHDGGRNKSLHEKLGTAAGSTICAAYLLLPPIFG